MKRATKLAIGCKLALRASRRPLRRFFRMTTFLCGISTLLDPLKKVAHAKDHDPFRSALGVARPSRRSPVGWRSLPSLTLCLVIIGFTTIPGNAVSALGYRIIQSIRVFQMPGFAHWIGSGQGRGSASVALARPSVANNEPGAENSVLPAADGKSGGENGRAPAGNVEPHAESSISSAVYSAAETPETFLAAEPNPAAQPVQAAAPAAVAPVARAPEPAPIASPVALPPAPQPTSAVPSAHPAAGTASVLVARGDDFMRARDIASARLFYEHAAELGDGGGALRMGATFDPAFLDRVGVRGTRVDQRQALSWYRRARDLGDVDADRLLKRLEPR
jgi:hypothetical protein